MLRALTIENIAVAKCLNIEFGDNFTVMTGQTGAGKSVIMDSLSYLLGGKAQRELIRSGENTARVTALFEPDLNLTASLKELGIEVDEFGELTIVRTLNSDGKNSAKINGKSVSVSVLRQASSKLVSMHGQNETVTLYDKNEYIRILDDYARNSELLTEYESIYRKLISKSKELKSFKESLGERSVLSDILKFQVNEIDKAKFSDFEEEEKLERVRARLKNSEHIIKSASLVSKALAPNEKGVGAAYLLERASAALLNLKDVLDGAEDMSSKLDEYRCELIDIAERARDIAMVDSDEEPDKQLDKIEARLNQITKLKRKYGSSIEEIIAFRDEAKKKLHDLDEGEAKIAELEHSIKNLQRNAKLIADELSKKRREAAVNMVLEITDILKYLDMPKVRFSIEIRKLSDTEFNLNKNGSEDVDFVVATNPGEPAQSLSKIASGGELSRIMLALKSVQARKAGAGTVVFDEIDTGVSGGTAERIGIKLKELSNTSQVICVTHSPQVSSHADCHCLIEKREINGRAESFVHELDYEERVDELARMIGGIEITEKQLSAAREMLNN